MDTNRLRYFCTVAKTQHLHRAAELLHISPAALSKAIKQLEVETELKLTTPLGRGIGITPEGKYFASEAEKLLEQFESLLKGAPAPLSHKSYRIGSFEVFTTYFLGPLLKEHLQVPILELRELGPGELEKTIAEEQVDLGITYVPIPRPELDFLKAGNIQMAVYGSKSIKLSSSWKDIPFAVPISPVSGSPTRIRGLDGWPDDKYPRFHKYQVTLMESALELCRQGLAVAYLPTFVAALHNEQQKEKFRLVNYSAKFPNLKVTQSVYLIKRKAEIENKVMKQIAKAIRILCKQSI